MLHHKKMAKKIKDEDSLEKEKEGKMSDEETKIMVRMVEKEEGKAKPSLTSLLKTKGGN